MHLIAFRFNANRSHFLIFLLVFFVLISNAGTAQDSTRKSKENKRYVPLEWYAHNNTSSSTVYNKKRISISFYSVPLEDALTGIAKKGEVRLSYNKALLPDRLVTISLKNETLIEAFQKILKENELKVLAAPSGQVVIKRAEKKLDAFVQTSLQTGSIAGQVTDAKTGEPLPNANIYLNELERGTATDSVGNYELTEIPNGIYTIRITYIGYQESEEQVTVNDGITTYNIALKRDIASLGEVQVVGYGEQSKRYSIQSISNIEAENFENFPVHSAQKILQGQSAGVQVVSSSGILGADPNVTIRGASSLIERAPLYVVDGVPLNDRSYAAGLGESTLNPIAEINPNDIESVSILKDAAATAIYGSRGSNGVVLITTKSGSFNEETRFKADYYTGWSAPTYKQDVMSANQYRNFVNDYAYGGMFDPNDPDDPFFGSRQASFDWPDAIFKKGRANNFSLSASGGTEKTSFYIGGTYLNRSSFLIGNTQDKLNARLNMEHNAADDLRLGFNLGISRLKYDRVYSSDANQSPLVNAYLQLPWNVPRDENGAFVQTTPFPNAIGYEELVDNTALSRRTTGNFKVEWDVIPQLTLKTDFGIDLLQLEQYQRVPFLFAPPSPDNTGGMGTRMLTEDNKWLSTTTLKYSAEFDGNHSLDILGGYVFETAEYRVTGVQGSGFVSNNLPNISSASTRLVTTDQTSKWAVMSYFSRLNYIFKERYIVELSARRDGSSRFGSDNRYGNFWTVSGGWIISEEAFLKDISMMNYLKLSLSYGVSGSDRGLDDFGARGLYNSGIDPNYAGSPGLTPQVAANPNLSWEETNQLDISLDTELFNQRLNLSGSYYVKNTNNMLQPVPQPYTTGFSSRFQNAGEVRNRGVDFGITSTNIRSDDFVWETTFNLGFLSNEVTDLPDENVDSQGRAFVEGTYQRAIEGESLNTFYLIRYSGIDQATGEAQWLTKDGELTSTPTSDDRVVVGSALPDYTGSLKNTLSYRNFDLSFMFNFVYGNKIFAGDGFVTDNPTLAGVANLSTRLLDYWKEPGDNAYAPASDAATAGTFSQIPSTLFLFDGSYIRLRNVTLGYNLPKSYQNKLSLSRARIYVTGQNLLTFSELSDRNIDPESNFRSDNYNAQGISLLTPPQAKTVTIGINIGF